MTFSTRRERRKAEKLQARQARNRRLAAGGASLSLLVGAVFASSTAAVAAPVSAVVKASTASTTTGLNMRSGPGVGNSVVTVLKRGAAVTPTGQSKGSWVRITASGRTGWVNAAYLSTGSRAARSTTAVAPSPRTVTTTSSSTGSASTTTSLNMRSGPGVGNSVVTVLKRGAVVSKTGKASGAWVQIKASGRTGWVNARYLKAASASSGRASTTLQYQLASATSPSSWKGSAASWARSKANSSATYYAWGGNGPYGYDCSGFTTGAFTAAGKSLPRTSRAQYTAADSYTSLGDIQIGDLVFWSNNGAASGIYHVAIYIGDGKIAHARNASSGVSVTSLNYSPYNMMKTAARFN
ncbi:MULTISPECIES: C40 family peptidase [Citricoccus]|uniref:C40 family peptidase n=1 Tax=Citricoccus TaxID=169133 RepID=UPI000255DDB3|nr:C40 family peptidase [Citricoccus sp. CH26A]